MLDAGLPDGAMLSAVYRPWPFLRVQAGGGTNSVSAGFRGGLAVLPFTAGPSLTVEGGWYFEGDVTGPVQQVTGSGNAKAMAQRLGYQFANLHVGVDFGEDSVFFFLHGGASYVRTELHGANRAFGSVTTDASGAPVTTFTINSDPVITAWVPSAKCGLIVFFV
jgi:hypothetical protein